MAQTARSAAHLPNKRVPTASIASQRDALDPIVDVVVPLPRNSSESVSSRLADLPSTGRALVSDLAMVTVLYLPEDDDAGSSQPHLVVSFRATGNQELEAVLDSNPVLLEGRRAISTRRYDASSGRRKKVSASDIVGDRTTGGLDSLVRRSSVMRPPPGGPTADDGAADIVGLVPDRSDRSDGWDDLTLDYADRLSLAHMDTLTPPLQSRILAATHRTVSAMLNTHRSLLRDTLVLDARDLLGPQLDVPPRLRTFCPSLLSPATDHLQPPSVLLDDTFWADPNFKYTDEVMRLLGAYFRSVGKMDQTTPYRTLFLDSHGLDQDLRRHEPEVPYAAPEALCGWVHVGQCRCWCRPGVHS